MRRGSLGEQAPQLLVATELRAAVLALLDVGIQRTAEIGEHLSFLEALAGHNMTPFCSRQRRSAGSARATRTRRAPGVSLVAALISSNDSSS